MRNWNNQGKGATRAVLALDHYITIESIRITHLHPKLPYQPLTVPFHFVWCYDQYYLSEESKPPSVLSSIRLKRHYQGNTAGRCQQFLAVPMQACTHGVSPFHPRYVTSAFRHHSIAISWYRFCVRARTLALRHFGVHVSGGGGTFLTTRMSRRLLFLSQAMELSVYVIMSLYDFPGVIFSDIMAPFGQLCLHKTTRGNQKIIKSLLCLV